MAKRMIKQHLVFEQADDKAEKQESCYHQIARTEKRQALRRRVKDITPCHHKQVYTQTNFVSKGAIAAEYEAGAISAEQAAELMLEAHDLMSHRGMSKQGVARRINEKMDLLLGQEKKAHSDNTIH